MTKQTFQIPEGCKAITMEQVGNQLVTTFEVEPKFEDGDILIDEQVGWAIYIYRKTDNPENGCYYCLFDSFFGLLLAGGSRYGYTSTARLATPEEAQRLWDALAKEGKRWNPKTMEVEKIKKDRWRGKVRERYFCISEIANICKSIEDGHYIDDEYYKVGNYFRTEEQAERAKVYIQRAYNDFWKEELK